MKRIFAAIKIHPEDQFIRIYEDLKSACNYDKLKWVELHNIHITLKFFGETEESRIPEIIDLLKDIALNHSSFNLYINNVGIFGSSYKPRVIWYGIDKNEKLLNLANDVLDRVQDIGFERDRQNFVPHLTIGRIKFIVDKQSFQKVIQQYKTVKIQEQKVGEFYLIESFLRPQGPEYKILQSFQLQQQKAV
jgi:2'-5' RNA ligase